jgi:hypothetical protein
MLGAVGREVLNEPGNSLNNSGAPRPKTFMQGASHLDEPQSPAPQELDHCQLLVL